MRKLSKQSRLVGAGLTTGAVVAALLVAPQAALAAATAVPSVGPASGTVTVTEDTPAAGFTSAAAALFVQLQAGTSCNSTALATSTTVFAANGTKTGNTVTFTVPSAATLGTNGVAKTYAICLYSAAAAGSPAVPLSSTPTYTVTAATTLSPTSGASGGGNTITVTAPTASPYFTGVTAPAAVFQTGACASGYPVSPSATSTATVTRSTVTATQNTVATIPVPTGVLGSGATASTYNVCIYTSTTAGSALLGATTYSVSLPLVTLSSSIGSSTSSTQGITAISTTSNFLTGVTSPGATFINATTCPTTFTATNPALSFNGATVNNVAVADGVARKLANNRLAVTVPALTPAGQYTACFYNGSTAGVSQVIAYAPYTSAVAPTATGISPNAGSATGGNVITVTGSNFPTGAGSITATLGGTALTGITPVNTTTFTAVAPAHAVANNVPLIVTTSAGSATLQSAYSYLNAIQVTPNTAPNTTVVDVAVQGIGFLTPTFGTSAGNARVFLVEGTYNSATDGTNRSNGPVAECSNVLPINDNELVCTLRLNRRLAPSALSSLTLFDPVAYTNTVTDVVTVQGSRVITSATNLFKPDDVGQPIVESSPGTNIPVGAYITSVISPGRATISAPALLGASAFTGTIGGAAVRSATFSTTTGSSTVNGSAGTFTSADIGRVLPATSGITAGTTITAVSANGATATLSAPVSTGAASASVSLYAASPVPEGAYNLTVVSNGDLDAATTDNTYSQSVVSSGSTFTVAAF